MSSTTLKRQVTALVPWMGSNRSLAAEVGQEAKGAKWACVPFAGSMTELRHIEARTILVSDLHRHLINLARVARCPKQGPQLKHELEHRLFHEDELREAQMRCIQREGGLFLLDDPDDNLQWAIDYFVVSWMSRSGIAGTRNEFGGRLCARWDAGGGDSAKRFRSAVAALDEWRRVMERCTFLVADAFEVIANVKDRPGHLVYCDPPFPDAGDGYRHSFTYEQHRRLALQLSAFEQTKVVCRFYDHELIRELYPVREAGGGWTWRHPKGGKTQTNAAAPEVLLINGPSRAEVAA